MKIKNGDQVRVIRGKHKGAEGKVVRVYPDKDRVLVEGVNLVKKHARSRGPRDPGGIIDKELPLPASNVMLLGSDGEPTRVGYTRNDEGKKVRIARRTGKELD